MQGGRDSRRSRLVGDTAYDSLRRFIRKLSSHWRLQANALIKVGVSRPRDIDPVKTQLTPVSALPLPKAPGGVANFRLCDL